MPRSARWTASPLLVMVLWSRLVSSDLVWRLWTKCSECQNQWFLFSLVIPSRGKETPWVKKFKCCFLSKNGCGSKKMIILYSCSNKTPVLNHQLLFFPSVSFYILCKYFVVPFRTFEMCVQRPCHCAFMWTLPWNMRIDYLSFTAVLTYFQSISVLLGSPVGCIGSSQYRSIETKTGY